MSQIDLYNIETNIHKGIITLEVIRKWTPCLLHQILVKFATQG